ncbi:hypothetical protein [Candidatus Nitrospira neomarina]|uniref:Transposase n=1 Tax=Candidatus Nitrospira neomarina TaxID=3020899 RepID=A0AA96JYD5_9BACT|nr:hypothetical protein [Candidatus Nitrospira neomarina]WNM64035.1 hypothetical protein PQG83_09840 [Candidatus Nitrospira neomarina]
MGQDQSEPIELWTAKRRANLVLQNLKGETSIPKAAPRHGLTVAEVVCWPDQFLRPAGHWG